MLLVLLALPVAPGIRADGFGDDAYAEGRRLFMSAYAAAGSATGGAPAQDPEALRNYPLYPYLVAARLEPRLGDPAADADLRAFIERYGDQPVGRSLRARWLMQLAGSKRWDTYLSVYRSELDDSLAARCNAYAARIALGRTDGMAAQALEDWESPKSLPSACDPAIGWLRAQGLLTPALIERRARAALAAGESSLARQLVATLPSAQAAPLLQWADLIDKPVPNVEALIANPTTSVEPAALLDGWRRYARADAELAAERYPALVASRGFDEIAAGPYALAVGYQLSLSRKPGALAFYALAQPGDYDERTWEWHARAAIWAGDWPRVGIAIAAMPDNLRTQARWKYWATRVADQNGDSAAARQGYASVIGSDNWYAVLASARLGQPYTPTVEPAGLTDAGIARVSALPAMVRARELELCDLQPQSVAEWRAGSAALPKEDQVQAIGLAARWGWYMQAIAAAAKLGIFNDYDLLYPRPYDAEVRRGASVSGLPRDLIYAIIRQESLYQPDARSSAGALGLMQLLPETARITAKKWRLPTPTRGALFDPSVNVALGSAHLRDMIDRWGGQASLAMGAYNAGPNAVKRWLPAEPMSLDAWVENIPYNETRGYVQRVSWHMIVFGWLSERKPRDVSSWLTTVRAPGVDDGEG